eukprot:TRINITY_DN5819_c0_g1_i2.p4 TRINITY_DN5819_c0_g1~~TRINITY_DN5819_c0_g1_i2.p4  ORF type:complete len:144 (-),score=17.39 TRINITY_DN5819_c0_g1_i2:42-473(-)
MLVRDAAAPLTAGRSLHGPTRAGVRVKRARRGSSLRPPKRLGGLPTLAGGGPNDAVGRSPEAFVTKQAIGDGKRTALGGPRPLTARGRALGGGSGSTGVRAVAGEAGRLGPTLCPLDRARPTRARAGGGKGWRRGAERTRGLL